LHRISFDEEATERQGALYDAYPNAHGYSDPMKDPEKFRAVLHLALLQAHPPDGHQANIQTSFIFYPKTHEEWVIDQIKMNAEAIFARFRAQKRVEAAKFMGECFLALRLGHLVFQVTGEPTNWMAFGFTRTDTLPQWMSDRLQDL
jgi:hypothetical protein